SSVTVDLRRLEPRPVDSYSRESTGSKVVPRVDARPMRLGDGLRGRSRRADFRSAGGEKQQTAWLVDKQAVPHALGDHEGPCRRELDDFWAAVVTFQRESGRSRDQIEHLVPVEVPLALMARARGHERFAHQQAV